MVPSFTHDFLGMLWPSMLAVVSVGALSIPAVPSIQREWRTKMHAVQMALPTSPKAVATEMSVAVQAALQARQYRLEVTTPPGLCFGLFGKEVAKQLLGDPSATPSASVRGLAERELAFLFVEMFQAYGAQCACVMRDSKQVKATEREWARSKLTPRVVDSLAKAMPASGGGGFGAATRSRVTEAPKVLIVSSASTQTLRELAPISEELGSNAVVVLLNPAQSQSTLPGGAPGRFAFESVFCLQDNPHPEWRGGLLYRAYPYSWELGAAGATGAPKVHGRSAERPTLDAIEAGFEKIEGDSNWFSQGGAAAALERRVRLETA